MDSIIRKISLDENPPVYLAVNIIPYNKMPKSCFICGRNCKSEQVHPNSWNYSLCGRVYCLNFDSRIVSTTMFILIL